MLYLYQPTLRFLVLLPHAKPSKTFIVSTVRWHGSMNNATIKERHMFEKKIPVSLSQISDSAFLQTLKQNICCNCHFSVKNGREMTEPEVKRAIESISEKFTEAMELMNDARSSSGTVYFSEDMEDTQVQVTETLNDYKALLGKLNENQKKSVIQTIGLKMEELKAQMSLLEDLAKE